MEDVNTAMGSMSSHMNDIDKILGLKFYGDVRFREEYFTQDQDNSPTKAPTARISDRNRLRFRLRFGATRAFGSSVTAGFQLASGAQSDITSTNQTLTNDFQMKTILIDRAFISWAPSVLDSKVRFDLGKFANPLTKTPITWDDDVNPEGIAATAEPISGTRLRAAYFVMRENSSYIDPFMICAQLEQVFKPNSDWDMTLTAGYEYVPYASGYLATPPAGTNTGAGAGVSAQSTGMLANAFDGGKLPDINTLDMILRINHKIDGNPVVWTFQGAFNYNSFPITPSTVTATAFKGAGYKASNEVAMFAQVAVGKVANAGDWAGSFEVGYIEPNAVFGLFSDSDSGTGFNNYVWLKGVGEVGIEDGLSFKLGQYVAWRENYDVFGGTPNSTLGGTSHAPVLRTQADLVVKL
jgi:hypothetical protein